MSTLVAVTGATGRVGAPLVEALLRAGYRIRALSRRPQPAREGVEWVTGDLRDPEVAVQLAAGCGTIYHAGGQPSGPVDEVVASLVDGTSNVLAAARRAKLIHLSSLVVLDTSDAAPRIDEASPLESTPQRRGCYTQAKSAAESLAREAAAQQDVVIVRPGQVVPCTAIPASAALRIGGLAVLTGPARAPIPLVHADDLAQGLLLAAATLSSGSIVHLVDPGVVTRADLLARLTRDGHSAWRAAVGSVPLEVTRRVARWPASRISDAAYRVLSAGVPHVWASDRAISIGWRPDRMQQWLA